MAYDTNELAGLTTGDRGSRGSARVWRVRSFKGGGMTDADLAATSGPRITLVVAALCLGLGLSVIWTGDVNETAAGFYPPAGASLVAMMVIPIRRWGWVIAGILVPTLIGLILGLSPLSSALLWGLANCVEPAVGALVVRHFRTTRWWTPNRMVVVFFVGAVVIAPIIGATLGTLGTVAGYESSWLGTWTDWALGDGLGVLVVAPLLLINTSRPAIRRTRGEHVALVVLVGGAAGLAFAEIGTGGAAFLPYLMLVALVWAGMRFGVTVVAAAGFVVALAANIASSMGVGPFSGGTGSFDGVTLQIFLVIALVASFVAAAMTSELANRDEVHRLLTQQATHDVLTGLPNRLLFTESLNRALLDRPAAAQPIAVVLIDLDDFKKVNDRYGHPAGDAALAIVADLLRAAVNPRDLLARLGGDEFVILFDNPTSCDEVIGIAGDLSQCLDCPILVDGVEHRLPASIGVAFVEADEQVTATDLMRRVDIALYRSKRTDGTRISVYDDALEASERRRTEMDAELRGAIERGEMYVQYQPIVHLLTGEVSKFEALARWTNSRLGVVGPDEFVPLAEQIGLINVIGDWVLEQACRQTATWRALPNNLGRHAPTVAVNVSARQLCDAAFPGRVRRILGETMLPARALTLEITETAVMDDLEASGIVIEELRQIGIELSMDDFGTGYSSLTYLRRIPVETLKIDRSFVAGLGAIREDTAIVESIISLGHSCGLEVVAEGIETVAQLQQLIRLGCDHGQGYLWSRPVDAAGAGPMLEGVFNVSNGTPDLGLSLVGSPAAEQLASQRLFRA
jgi:diguanylate cyclase (GGDEF)-like protein